MLTDAETLTGLAGNRAVYHLRRLISEDGYGAGDVLPSERSLADRLDVHRTTLRKALARLSEQGVIRRGGDRVWVVNGGHAPGEALSSMIGVLTTADAQSVAGAASGNDFAINRGVMRAVHTMGRHAVVLNPKLVDDERDIDRLASQKLAGIVATEEVGADPAGVRLLGRLHDRGLAVAVHGNDQSLQRFDRVYSDHYTGAKLLLRHLASIGRRRVLRLWTSPSDRYWVRARDTGYLDACAELGLPALDAQIMPGTIRRSWTPSPAENEARARQMVGFVIEHVRGPEPIDAVMLFTDYDAFAVAGALRICGVDPTRDVLIAGYDNVVSHCWERAIDPHVPHVTIEKRNTSAGEALVELLVRRMGGALPPTPQATVSSPELVVCTPA